MILIGAVAVFNVEVKNNLKALWENKILFLFFVYFLVHLLGVFTADDLDFWLVRFRLKLPFLVFPLAFASMPRFDRTISQFLMVLFLLLLLSVSIPVFSDMLVRFDELKEMYSKGKVIETPFNHIRFSLMIAFGTGLSLFLYLKKWVIKNSKERFLYAGLSIFFFLFLHLLAVRSGLVCFYIAAFVALVMYVAQSKKYLLGLGLLVVMLGVPYVLVNNVPSLKKKMHHTMYTWERINKPDKMQKMSDSKRQVSWQLGYNLVKENPFTGVGIGNVLSEMNDQYDRHFPDFEQEHRLIPHNQFLFVGVAFGLIYMCVFIATIFAPLTINEVRTDILYVFFFTIMLMSFLFEATIEGALGTAIYLIFTMVLLHRIKSEAYLIND